MNGNLYFLFSFLSIASIGISGLLVVAGVFSIKRERERKREKISLHRKFMLSATFFSFLFLILYLLKVLLFEPVRYRGDFRTLYLIILTAHSLLATVNIPLVISTLFFALKGDFARHKKIARITAPCWIITAVSGWIVFAFLVSE